MHSKYSTTACTYKSAHASSQGFRVCPIIGQDGIFSENGA